MGICIRIIDLESGIQILGKPAGYCKWVAPIILPEAYAGKLPIEKVAHTLARAAGHWGSCAQYLFRTVTMLEEHGIRDRNIWRIQSLVAKEILEHSPEITGKRAI